MISKILENRYYKAGTVYLTVEDLALHGEGLLKDLAGDLLEARGLISDLSDQITMLREPTRDVLDHSDLATAQYFATSENPMERRASSAIMKLAAQLAESEAKIAQVKALRAKPLWGNSGKVHNIIWPRDLEAALK